MTSTCAYAPRAIRATFIYTPDVQLITTSARPRGTLDPLEDRNRFIRRWDIFGTFKDSVLPRSVAATRETMFYLPR